jgi:hypothetical protein
MDADPVADAPVGVDLHVPVEIRAVILRSSLGRQGCLIVAGVLVVPRTAQHDLQDGTLLWNDRPARAAGAVIQRDPFRVAQLARADASLLVRVKLGDQEDDVIALSGKSLDHHSERSRPCEGLFPGISGLFVDMATL